MLWETLIAIFPNFLTFFTDRIEKESMNQENEYE